VLPAVTFELDGALHVGDAGVLAAVLYAWSSGRVVFKGARWSDVGSALIVPKALRFEDEHLKRTYAGDGMPMGVVSLAATLEHLTKNSLLSAERGSSGWVIRLGPRLRDVTGQ
jgi:hypothetical protein